MKIEPLGVSRPTGQICIKIQLSPETPEDIQEIKFIKELYLRGSADDRGDGVAVLNHHVRDPQDDRQLTLEMVFHYYKPPS